ncbi:MAG: T9SS type A sorting domain-containing protein [Bacteroidota bacterium]
MKRFLTRFMIILTLGFSKASSAQNFTVVDSVPEGAYGNAAWGDFNNDGFKDLCYISQVLPNAACKIFTFNGTSFSEIIQQLPMLYNAGVCWGDLNNDGFDDLVVNGADSTISGSTFIYQSLGNGTFIPMPNTIPGLSAGSVDVADYNNDGWKDIAVTGMNDFGVEKAFIYKNNGSFVFTDVNASLAGVHFGEIKWGDFNNDGLKDLLINGIGSFDFRARIYQNMGQDTFQLLNIYMKGSGGTADWCDFDHDGWQDVLISGYDSTSTGNFIELHHNNHNNTFSIVTSGLPDFGEPVSLDIADFNNDSLEDICFMGGSTAFPITGSALSFNQGNSLFLSQPFLSGNITNCIVSAADYDNDGDVDLFFGTYFLRNDGVTGVEENDRSASVSIYPNPSNDLIHVSSSISFEEVEVYTMVGEKLKSVGSNERELTINAKEIPAGNYIVRINSKEAVAVMKKITIIR